MGKCSKCALTGKKLIFGSQKTVRVLQSVFTLLDLLESSIVRLIVISAPFDRDNHFPSVWELILGCQKKPNYNNFPITNVSVERTPLMD